VLADRCRLGKGMEEGVFLLGRGRGWRRGHDAKPAHDAGSGSRVCRDPGGTASRQGAAVRLSTGLLLLRAVQLELVPRPPAEVAAGERRIRLALALDGVHVRAADVDSTRKLVARVMPEPKRRHRTFQAGQAGCRLSGEHDSATGIGWRGGRAAAALRRRPLVTSCIGPRARAPIWSVSCSPAL